MSEHGILDEHESKLEWMGVEDAIVQIRHLVSGESSTASLLSSLSPEGAMGSEEAMTTQLDLYQTTGTSPPEGIAPTIQEGKPGNLRALSLVRDESSGRAKRASANSFRDGLSQSQPPADGRKEVVHSRDGSGCEPVADPAPSSLPSGRSSGSILCNGERPGSVVTWVDDVLSSADYLALRSKLVKAKWRKHRRLWNRLALTRDDLIGVVDVHVFRVLSERQVPPANVVNFLSVVTDRKLRDERRKAKRRIESERFIEDGEADEKPTKVGVRFDLDSAIEAKAILWTLALRPGGKDAIVQALGLMAQADVATRKRISRFYIDLAAENGISTEHAHAWVDVLIRTMLSPRAASDPTKGSS